MEITIKIKNVRELNRIKKILEGEKINVLVGKRRKRLKPSVPNKITEEVFKKTNKGKELVFCKNVDDFFKKIGI